MFSNSLSSLVPISVSVWFEFQLWFSFSVSFSLVSVSFSVSVSVSVPVCPDVQYVSPSATYLRIPESVDQTLKVVGVPFRGS